eukprot:CAMPEP_0205820582 /NCGR_PEP_ID=MMETSP0206-20130828/3233_1 /ASSEMBLY_ACC=CAM_ASM_000279 /TAXON_ID=36767 /ORGANISM="Euplotes focardii, Strain TN1" /LENGTH=218 /DNA_ID=CAMNT_0053115427 /DNA_START=60 /DNA_END=716 /DNA_ORIENTATION=+
MSKLNAEALREAVQSILANAGGRKFTETIELQIALKNYDPNKERRFSGTIRLPLPPRKTFNVCVLADAKHIADCAEAGIPSMSVDDLKKLKKDKKLVKKLAKQYDAFLASATLIRKIPRLLGPGLNKAGKFPSPLGANADVSVVALNSAASVKFQLKSKKALCLGVAVGNVEMDEEDVVTNVTLAINFLASLLPKGWMQIKRLYVKSTMGPSHRIHGF